MVEFHPSKMILARFSKANESDFLVVLSLLNFFRFFLWCLTAEVSGVVLFYIILSIYHHLFHWWCALLSLNPKIIFYFLSLNFLYWSLTPLNFCIEILSLIQSIHTSSSEHVDLIIFMISYFRAGQWDLVTFCLSGSWVYERMAYF